MIHLVLEPKNETIQQYIERAIESANDQNVILNCAFNGGVFEVPPKSDVDTIYNNWKESLNDRHIKFESRFETIYQYIERALLKAAEKNSILDCEFNGAEFVVTKHSTMHSAYADWERAMEKQEEEYKKSDEYKTFQREQEMKKERMNQEVVILLDKFNTLDLRPTTYEGMKAVLDWLAEYQNYSDCVLCTESNDAYVVEKLKENGYIANNWVGAPKNTFQDMRCYFEYIVGQAISTMEVLAMHSCVVVYRDMWVEDFKEK